MIRLKTLIGMIALLGWAVATLPAQDQPDPKVALDELQTEAASKTQEELKKDVEAWFSAVKAKEKELAKVAKERKAASGEEKDTLTKKVEAVREERAEILRRFEIVLEAFEDKGGEVASYRAYVKNLPAHIDYKDPSAVWNWLVNWVKSPNGGVKWGLNILAFLAILIGFIILSRIAARIVSRILRTSHLKVSDLLRDFFVNAARKIILVVGIVMALGQIGIDVGPLLAGIGVVGFILGFALQGTLSNFASGIMILMYRPFDVGHYIEAAGAKGTVSEMTLVSTTLLTPDNQIVVIPNSSIWGGVITNVTGKPTRRLDLVFGIGYDDDIEKAQTIFEEEIKKHEKVLADPKPNIQVNELGDSSVNFIVRPWCKTSDYWSLKWDLTRAIKKRLDAEGISIPFPQRDVHVYQVDVGKRNGED